MFSFLMLIHASWGLIKPRRHYRNWILVFVDSGALCLAPLAPLAGGTCDIVCAVCLCGLLLLMLLVVGLGVGEGELGS